MLKGSRIVMKGKRIKSLYYLEAKTIVGEASTVSDNNVRLWHLRIAHISEGGLNELRKQGIIPKENKFQLAQCE